MIKYLLKYILTACITVISVYTITYKITAKESIIIGRPVEVVVILPSKLTEDTSYDENVGNNHTNNDISEEDTVLNSDTTLNNNTPEDEPISTEVEEIEKAEYIEDVEEIEDVIDYKNFEITFYTSVDCENGFGPITSTGEPLADTMLLASNVYDIGTKIYLEGLGELEVKDRGGSEMNSSHRLDVYIPRQIGESDYEYRKRAFSYGRQTVQGYIIK